MRSDFKRFWGLFLCDMNGEHVIYCISFFINF